jgi:hypothetical protein
MRLIVINPFADERESLDYIKPPEVAENFCQCSRKNWLAMSVAVIAATPSHSLSATQVQSKCSKSSPI